MEFKINHVSKFVENGAMSQILPWEKEKPHWQILYLFTPKKTVKRPSWIKMNFICRKDSKKKRSATTF